MNLVFFCVLFGAFYAPTKAQDHVRGILSDGLLECYNNTAIALGNKLPHNMHSLIAIIRKIEDNPTLQMNLRQLSVALLHRFRQDGIVKDPKTIPYPGVNPYAPSGMERHKCAKILEMIPGASNNFPNESLTLTERCSLHSMLSSSIDINERGDESTTCRTQSDQYRSRRSLRGHRDTDKERIGSDVETLTPEELETMKNKNEDRIDVDPNSFYPALPPNHPENAQIRTEKTSQCPLATGIISTEWGSVAGGSVLSGIAAGMQPQNVKISELVRKDWREMSRISSDTVSNKWMATLAGDLAEVALRQGPYNAAAYTIGVEGHWNSSIFPKYYFMEENENTEFTAAEIRGDLDGLILASEIESWYKQIPSLRLSQVLDMYYSDRGALNASMRACNRRVLLTSVAPNDTASTQAWRATEALHPDITGATIAEEARRGFAVKATNELLNFIPSHMNNDKDCQNAKVFNRLAVDLSIFVDTNWPWSSIQPIFTVLLENSEINKFASNFTLINALNGAVMINNTNSILDFYSFNETHYSSHTRGFDLPKTMDVIQSMEKRKLSKEWEARTGGARSNIALIIPYTTAQISDLNKDYCVERLKKMHEDIPDTSILFLTAGSKDRWSDLTRNPSSDVVSINPGSIREAKGPIISLTNRMKRVPRRLVNSQCGANWSASGDSASYTNYLEPSGINFYRLHPNYFYTTDGENVPAVKIQGFNGAKLTVCSSREPLHINKTDQSNCKTITSDSHKVTVSCGDAAYIHECNPLYLSIATDSMSNSINQCTEHERCRYPDMMKYTISYENLRCINGAGSLIFSPILLLTALYVYIRF